MKTRTLAIFALAIGVSATAARGEMSAQQIIDRMEKERQKTKDYTAEVKVSFKMPQMRIAPMRVKVYYKHPDRVKAEPLSGFAIIPKRGLTMEWPKPDLKDADVKVSRVQLAGRPAYLLTISIRQPKPQPPGGSVPGNGRLWVDRERWVPLKFEMREARGGSLTVQATYTKVAKRHWLPKKVAVEITMPAAEEGQQKGTVKLEFSKYRVNTGLSDKLFEEGPKR